MFIKKQNTVSHVMFWLNLEIPSLYPSVFYKPLIVGEAVRHLLYKKKGKDFALSQVFFFFFSKA